MTDFIMGEKLSEWVGGAVIVAGTILFVRFAAALWEVFK